MIDLHLKGETLLKEIFHSEVSKTFRMDQKKNSDSVQNIFFIIIADFLGQPPTDKSLASLLCQGAHMWH